MKILSEKYYVFHQDNLEVSTCVDMLLLSWHLNLDRMTRKIVTFIALNFPMLMEDMDMMATVPVELMSQVTVPYSPTFTVIRNVRN